MLECLGRLELLRANDGRFEINQLLFAEDAALVADSEEKLCRLVSEFGRACGRRKLRVDVGMSKAMRSRPLEEWDFFTYLGSQVAADGGCESYVVHKMNEEYRA